MSGSPENTDHEKRPRLTSEQRKKVSSLNPFSNDPAFVAEVHEARKTKSPRHHEVYQSTFACSDEKKRYRLLWFAWELNPHHHKTLAKIADIELKQKNLQSAVKILQACISLEPRNAIDYTQIAACLVSLKEYNGALLYAEQAVRLAPDDARAHYIVGRVHKEMFSHAQAIASFETATRINPTNILVLNDLCIVLAREHRNAEALTIARSILKLKPTDRVGLRMHILLSVSFKSNTEALKLIQRYESLHPESEPVLSSKVHALFYERRYLEAVTVADKILKIRGDDVRYLTIAGASCIWAGRPENALQYLGHQSLNQSEHGLWLRSKALAQVGRREDALSSLISLIQVSGRPKLAYLAALFSLAPEGHPKHVAIQTLLRDPILYAQALDASRRYSWERGDTEDDIEFSKSVANSFNTLTFDRPVNKVAIRVTKGAK